MQSERSETIKLSRPGNDSILPSTDFSEKTISENQSTDTEPVNTNPEQAQLQARTEMRSAQDGGYGWVCVLCVFLANAHTWEINSVGYAALRRQCLIIDLHRK